MSKHIVVIDDCDVVLTMASEVLRAAGYRISTANCGVYSNHLIYTNTPPDLILLDLVMPLMSGEKKLKLLKSRKKSWHIPVMLISSQDDVAVIADARGAVGYLRKPFSREELLDSVHKLLRKPVTTETGAAGIPPLAKIPSGGALAGEP